MSSINFETAPELSNGGKVMMITSTHVPASFRGQFVTWQWMQNESGKLDCYHGHYFEKNLADAVAHIASVAVGEIKSFT